MCTYIYKIVFCFVLRSLTYVNIDTLKSFKIFCKKIFVNLIFWGLYKKILFRIIYELKKILYIHTYISFFVIVREILFIIPHVYSKFHYVLGNTFTPHRIALI